jgi:hypothetical protein
MLWTKLTFNLASQFDLWNAKILLLTPTTYFFKVIMSSMIFV